MITTSTELTTVVVFDQGLYRGKGIVNRWITGITEKFEARAILLAPVNKRGNTGHGAPGLLKASIRHEMSHPSTREIIGEVSVNTSYAIFVLKGTTGPITTAKAKRFASGKDKRLSGPFEVITRKTSIGPGGKGQRGRGTYLRARPGYFMVLPINMAFGARSRFHYAVSGQKAQNFLGDAYEGIARTHSALHPIGPRFR